MSSQKRENVFSNRNFRLVFLGALVSELGALLYSFAVSFYILEISGNSAFLQGLYLALCGVSMLIFTPVGGVLGDRFNKAKIMYLCDYVKGGTILLAAALMLVFREPNAHIAILFALGILGNAVSGVFKLCKVTSITSIGSQGMIPVASVLAGVILQSLGSTALLAFCSLGFSLTAVLMLINRQVREI